MKYPFRVLTALCCSALFCVSCFAVPVRAEDRKAPPAVSAESALLLTADTGAVLFEKNARTRRAMASTTKVMTALLALEEAERSGDPVVEVTAEMVAVEGSSMGLQAGDRLKLTELTAGMLLASGNDAANAAALFLDGSLESFAGRMNARAEELGLCDTHFVTPSGLDDDAHFSTACDMALLTREALKNPAFRRICGSYTAQVEFLEPAKRVSYTNHNKLLQTYEGCIGVKTGFTKKAGRCLISAAERNGVTLIVVTLNAPDDWDDHAALLDYGFSTVKQVSFDGSGFKAFLPVAGSETETVKVSGAAGGCVSMAEQDAANIICKVLLPAFCYAPVKPGDKVGVLQYCQNGDPIYSVPILAREAADACPPEPTFWEKLFGT